MTKTDKENLKKIESIGNELLKQRQWIVRELDILKRCVNHDLGLIFNDIHNLENKIMGGK